MIINSQEKLFISGTLNAWNWRLSAPPKFINICKNLFLGEISASNIVYVALKKVSKILEKIKQKSEEHDFKLHRNRVVRIPDRQYNTTITRNGNTK
jgi:hypothetical protein